MEENTKEVFTVEEEFIQLNDFIEEIRTAIKDLFAAKVRRYRDELTVSFPDGRKFMISVCLRR